MHLRRKLAYGLAATLLSAAMGISVAGPALADSGPGGGGGGGSDIRLFTTGTCGDQMRLRVRNTGDTIELDITIPSADPSENWSLSATQQDYGAVTGGRHGDPVSISPGALPPLTFNATEGGFVSSGSVSNPDNNTRGISYTATRTSPSPVTCTNQGFWTNPFGSSFGPASQNPTDRPQTPPSYNTLSEVDQGTNDALMQFDQEMLDSGLGIPATNRFILKVNGVARTVTAVTIVNDDPPNLAILDLTFDGAPIAAGDTVTVQYAKPLTASAPALQDPDGFKTASFGPVTLTVV